MNKPTNTNIKKKISFDIQPKLLEEMDKLSKESGYKRSNWICMAIMEKLSRDRENEK